MASISDDGMVLSGYHKKLKTMKKKFFVLYEETINSSARLEYYDTEKKFLQRAEPKRVIYLRNCFNINRRLDTKHRFVIVLSSREGGFGIVLESENDLRKWLDKLLFLQRNLANRSGQVYSAYDQVWQVVIQKKGMSEKVGITGTYHCCLTSKSLTFVCIGPEKTPNGDDRVANIEILLTTIRRCGHASPQCIFYMELGRQSVLGSGELWMETDNPAIATNMHNTILSAMSAKTESNTNLINVYQARPDISHEPMRKRSSSANEASKPINVIQNRQNSLELRNCSSPHNYSFGRERCDSLPTRNGTLSESSNQTYFGSNHGLRSNTISGIRPHSSNKHSNSPTFALPSRCSESEESSISIDESDDNGSFSHYRLNTRSSETAIPEENIDDFTSAEFSKVNEQGESETAYVPMTPIKPTIFGDVIFEKEKNELQSSEDANLHFDFPEHSSEKLAKDFDLDSDNQCGRPIRAYSIGNKVEHLKLNKRLGYLNDTGQNSNRVRAYSVGSKSKIPRCDLQRVVLVEDNKHEFVTNRSHSSITKDGPSCGTSANREKKSTSAPLLSLKNQINPDRMSDLMEIDFSQATNLEKQNFIKNIEIPKYIETVFPTNTRIDSSSSTLHATSQKDILNGTKMNNTASSSEGGYLEMKPVGNAYIPSTNCLPSKIEMLKLKDTFGTPVLDVNKISTYHIATEKWREQSRSDEKKPNSPLNEKPISLKPTTIESNNLDLYSQNDINIEKKILLSDKQNNVDEKIIENNNLNIGGYEEKKLVHSISSEDYTQIKDKSNEFTKSNEVGYKILQIKSDSSLTSSKLYQKGILKDNLERQLRLTESVNTIHDNAISSATKFNIYSKTLDSKSTDSSTQPNILQIKDLSFPSRSTSRISQPELHYASLDLPHCSGQNPAIHIKRGSRESPPVAACPGDGNTYAKIDFDQSDSSSSSSNIFNT
ncbi:insulin receptor substrate 1 isoform X1 [Drosophila rhopaloa]|uniref:Insulin receptor substrate 1 n=1 Tax=Drosophila rhopaloa TaxID=1041015 RepID=A0ABM5HMD8_DRORH|nr:insulin receptor substrate 1 isoform X1 [Drosophila rhopaloa]XP_016982484.2 insulin receptor substrate 1 isoform X1 [Drosophila rhopaloa]